MKSVEGNMPMWLRVLTIVLGILGLIAGVLVLLFPEISILTLVIVMAVGLLFLGLSRLGISIAEPGLPGWLRALGIVVGIIAIILWILVLVFPGFGVALLIAFLAVGLIFHGIDRVSVDGMNQDAPGWSRGLAIVAGVLLIIFGILVILFPGGFGVLTVVLFLSIGLIIAGLSAIASGVAGIPLSTIVAESSG
ncbi:MAG: HdeD family acid-resistance protein [Thermoplasmata archaeon]